MAKYSEELKDEIRTCINDEKNPNSCIEKVMKEHNIPLKEKGKVLVKAMEE